jgi:multidrug resistance protein
MTVKVWLPALSLSVAAFIFVTTEFMPVGLLTDIANDLHQTESFTGLIMTVYAWMVAVLSLPMTVFTARINRRRLVLILLAVFTVANLLAGFATTFGLLMLARIGVAIAHSVFWSITTPLVTRIAPAGKEIQALGMITVGTALANILGIPLGTLLGHLLGWRASFIAIALFAVLVSAVIFFLLPETPSENAGSFRSLPSLFRRRPLVLVYVLVLLTITGYFAAYTYISPFLQKVGGLNGNQIVLILLFGGASGILGSFIAGRYLEQRTKIVVTCSLFAIAICEFGMVLASPSLIGMIVLNVIWGSALTIAILAFQNVVLKVAADAADVAVSLFSGIFNVGIGGGALIGSVISRYYGLSAIGYVGAVFIVFSALLSRKLESPNQLRNS